MNIAIVGGTGTVGAEAARELAERGHAVRVLSRHAPEYPVDLAELEARLPDNSYWRLSSPTEDPLLLQQREVWRAETNRAYGRIVAGEATEAEIEAYYAEVTRVSADYVALATLILEEYGDRLPERDRGLFELGAKMHAGRLTEVPRRLAEAHERRRLQEQRRAAWR